MSNNILEVLMNKKFPLAVMVLFVLVIAVAPVFSGGQQESAGADELRVTFMVHDLGNPFWASQAKGAEEMAEELGVKFTVVDLQVDPAKEINTWENLITSKVDGIMISCVDEKASNEYCRKAQDAGIKVMAAVHPLEGADGSLSNDEYNYGFLEGVEAGKFIKNELGGKAKFALLAADATPFVIPRTDGIRDGILSEAPNAELIARQDAHQTDTGMAVIESILQAHPDLAVVGCLNDNGALGAYEAMMAAKKDPEKTWIGGTDGVDQALKLIKEGGMYRASVSMAPYESGKQEMGGERVEAHQKIVNEAITIDNIAKYLK
jgi:ABC-type sugar transport system substrate-binding protein